MSLDGLVTIIICGARSTLCKLLPAQLRRQPQG